MLKTPLALSFLCIVLNTNTAFGQQSPNDSSVGDSGFPLSATFATPYSSVNANKTENKPFLAVSYMSLRENNNRYLESIKKLVRANWRPPSSTATTSIVSLEIDKDGEIIDVKSILPSGNTKYDRAALASIVFTHHFMRPPKDLQLPVAITFNSDLRLADNEWASRDHPTPWDSPELLNPATH